MKKYKIILFVCFFVSCLFLFHVKETNAKNVAKTCIYDDASENNNEANHSVKIELYEGDNTKCSAWITMFDGKEMNNKEACQGWNSSLKNTYYTTGECPKYVLATYKKWAILSAQVYVSNDLPSLEERLSLQTYPSVILRSLDFHENEPSNKKQCMDYKDEASCPEKSDYGKCRWNANSNVCEKYDIFVCEDYASKDLCPKRDEEGTKCRWDNTFGCIREEDDADNEGEEKNPSEENRKPNYKVDNDASIGGMCSMPQYRKPMKFLGSIVWLFKILVPIIIIGFGVLDLYKAVTGSKDDTLKKAFQSILVRVIAGVFVFLLPGLIQFVLNMINEWSEYQNDWCCCTECLLNPDCNVNACDSKSCHIEGTN